MGYTNTNLLKYSWCVTFSRIFFVIIIPVVFIELRLAEKGDTQKMCMILRAYKNIFHAFWKNISIGEKKERIIWLKSERFIQDDFIWFYGLIIYRWWHTQENETLSSLMLPMNGMEVYCSWRWWTQQTKLALLSALFPSPKTTWFLLILFLLSREANTHTKNLFALGVCGKNKRSSNRRRKY